MLHELSYCGLEISLYDLLHSLEDNKNLKIFQPGLFLRLLLAFSVEKEVDFWEEEHWYLLNMKDVSISFPVPLIVRRENVFSVLSKANFFLNHFPPFLSTDIIAAFQHAI